MRSYSTQRQYLQLVTVQVFVPKMTKVINFCVCFQQCLRIWRLMHEIKRFFSFLSSFLYFISECTKPCSFFNWSFKCFFAKCRLLQLFSSGPKIDSDNFQNFLLVAVFASVFSIFYFSLKTLFVSYMCMFYFITTDTDAFLSILYLKSSYSLLIGCFLQCLFSKIWYLQTAE